VTVTEYNRFDTVHITHDCLNDAVVIITSITKSFFRCQLLGSRHRKTIALKPLAVNFITTKNLLYRTRIQLAVNSPAEGVTRDVLIGVCIIITVIMPQCVRRVKENLRRRVLHSLKIRNRINACPEKITPDDK